MFFKHLATVTRHRFLVWLYLFKCGFPFRGLFHDLTKFSFTEFFLSIKYYQGVRSPVFKEREVNHNYSEIGIHHTNRNKHHWEYWVDFYRGTIVIRTLPYKICIEIICDMISASKVYGNQVSILEYFTAREKYFYIHSLTKEYIKAIFSLYENEGFKGLKRGRTRKLYVEMFNNQTFYEQFKVTIEKID
jgi:hypothetical protein